jgi:hypothetical protein
MRQPARRLLQPHGYSAAYTVTVPSAAVAWRWARTDAQRQAAEVHQRGKAFQDQGRNPNGGCLQCCCSFCSGYLALDAQLRQAPMCGWVCQPLGEDFDGSDRHPSWLSVTVTAT